MREKPSTLLNGWYGLIRIGEKWRPVTIPENRRTLMLSEANRAGATHVAFWDGKGWDHIVEVDRV
jgi:hypothetical protein